MGNVLDSGRGAGRRRRRFGRTVAALTGLGALAALPACSSGDDPNTLHVYSGRHYGIETAFDQFTEDTGIKVEFLTGNDSELRERIVAEGEDTEADAYITVDAGNLAVGAEQGIFRPIDSPALDAVIPAEYSDPEGRWYGLALRMRTIVYSPDRVAADEVPTTYEELAEPQWQGRLCLRVSTNVYQQSLVASLIANDGEERALEIVRGWAANAEIVSNDVLLLESIADGICDVGLANHYYLARKLEEDPNFPVALQWANQDDRGVHVNVSGGGVTTHAKRPELAQRFLEWLGTDGQSVMVDVNHEYPANTTVAAEPLITERFGLDFKRDPLGAAEYGALNADAVRLMDEAGYQ
ncbi:MAG: extracellular solute-binding protein [Acidimicrobiia bacterium]